MSLRCQLLHERKKGTTHWVKTINKTTKFDDIIQNLNDDRYAYQDLGCIPRDFHIKKPDNGELVSVKIFSSLCKYTHTTHTYVQMSSFILLDFSALTCF